jgi:hypothetical protein
VSSLSLNCINYKRKWVGITKQSVYVWLIYGCTIDKICTVSIIDGITLYDLCSNITIQKNRVPTSILVTPKIQKKHLLTKQKLLQYLAVPSSVVTPAIIALTCSCSNVRWITWANVLFNNLIGQIEILTWVQDRLDTRLPPCYQIKIKGCGVWLCKTIPMKLNFTSAQFECIWSEFN